LLFGWIFMAAAGLEEEGVALALTLEEEEEEEEEALEEEEEGCERFRGSIVVV
jgi:hypothetical protein